MNGSEGPLSERRADYAIAKPGMTIKSRSISPENHEIMKTQSLASCANEYQKASTQKLK